MTTSIYFRWLGVGGVELSVEGRTLVIDPYFTRFPFWRMWFGRAQPNRELIAEKIRRCDVILVSHAHWDHLMDVPDVARNTGAIVVGSPNTCQLLSLLGVPASQIHEVGIGDRVELAGFQVDVLSVWHQRFPGWRLFSGALPPDLHPPLRARDYKMDVCFGFLIQVDKHRLLHGVSEKPGQGVSAEVVFDGISRRRYHEAVLASVKPQVFVPIHWDDLYRPLSQPVRPMLFPTGRVFPPLRPIDLTQFACMIEQISPGTRVIIPEMFRVYDLASWLVS